MTESTAVMSVEEQLKARLATQVKVTGDMAGGSNQISFKGGQIIVDGNIVPGGEMNVIVLGILNERTFYPGAFDPNKIQTPACYSYNGELPHAEAAAPQHTNCRGCEQDKWGSATTGRGKACREAARLAIISADADFESAPIYTCRIPISSISTAREFAAKASAAGKLVGQYTVKLIVKPDSKSFFSVTLMAIGPNPIDLSLLLPRMNEADGVLTRPYPVIEEEAAPEKPLDKNGKAKY